MFWPLKVLLRHLVRTGDLTIVDAAGRRHRFGDASGLAIAVQFASRALEWRLAFDPQLALGVGFMRGDIIVERGTLYDFVALLASNAELHRLPGWARHCDRLRYGVRRIVQYNPARRARSNVAHHYDIPGTIYDLFLDRDRQYSCAYFQSGSTLEDAQLLKKRHLAAKLRLEPGQRLLDIGSGWGGLGLYLAKVGDVDVTGLTLSVEQIRIAQDRARREGLERAVRFSLEDYRAHHGRYDRIVSVGMFEHVGVSHHLAFFRQVAALLNDDGAAVIHSIGRSEPPSITNPFIARHIFPGGYIPALSEMVAPIERAGLIITDVEVLRRHYAETLREWRHRFLASRDEAVAIAGEEFCRKWEFYLAGSEAAFRYQGLVVFQIQMVKRIETLPITRDYIGDAETKLAGLEQRAGTKTGIAGPMA